MLTPYRVSLLLRSCCSVLVRDDIQGCAETWKEESPSFHIDMLDCWIRFRHVGQSFWHCTEIDLGGEQPIQQTLDLYVCHRSRGLHTDTDELL